MSSISTRKLPWGRTSSDTVHAIRFNIPTVRIYFWVQEEEFFNLDIILLGELGARIIIDISFSVICPAAIYLANCDRS